MTDPTRRSRRLAAAWIGLLVLASVVDPSWLLGSGGSGTVVGIDTWFHLAGYAVLAWLLAGAFDHRARDGRRALVAVAVATAVGVGVEFLQAPIPFRTASVADAVANAVGAVVGVAARRGWRTAGEAARTGE